MKRVQRAEQAENGEENFNRHEVNTPSVAPGGYGALACPAEHNMSGDAEAWLTKLKLCISETVSMRHPRPMEHIATMLLDPSFEQSLSLHTAEYVRQHEGASALELAVRQPTHAYIPVTSRD